MGKPILKKFPLKKKNALRILLDFLKHIQENHFISITLNEDRSKVQEKKVEHIREKVIKLI